MDQAKFWKMWWERIQVTANTKPFSGLRKCSDLKENPSRLINFEYLVPSWWNSLRKIKRCDQLEEVCHWDQPLRFQKTGPIPRVCSSPPPAVDQNVSSQPFMMLCHAFASSSWTLSKPLTPLTLLNSFLSCLGHRVCHSNRKETNRERPPGLYPSVYYWCQPKF